MCLEIEFMAVFFSVHIGQPYPYLCCHHPQHGHWATTAIQPARRAAPSALPASPCSSHLSEAQDPTVAGQGQRGTPPPAELEVGVMSFRKNFKGGVGASLATFHCYPRTPECNAPGARPTDGSPHTARLPPLLTEHVRGRAGQSPAPTSSARARRPSSGFRRRPAGARGVPGPPPPLVRSPRAPPPDPRRRAAWSG